MGMYTHVRDWNFEFRTKRSRKLLKEWLEETDVPEYIPARDSIDTLYMREKESLKEYFGSLGSLGSITDFFNESKVIGYWYKGFCYVVRDLAKFIKGYIDLELETGSAWVRIEFKDGAVFTRDGYIQWKEAKSATKQWRLNDLPPKEKLMRSV